MKNLDPFTLHTVLERRFLRWKVEWAFLPSPQHLSARACEVAELHLPKLPPCVTSAVIKSWCNGWVTTRRFKEVDTGCVFGCQAAEHSLEHYAVCNACTEAWTRMTNLHNHNGPLGFFAFGYDCGSVVRLRCLHLYAVYTVVMRQNAIKCKLPSSGDHAFRCLRERWMYALGRSVLLRSDRAFVLASSRTLDGN